MFLLKIVLYHFDIKHFFLFCVRKGRKRGLYAAAGLLAMAGVGGGGYAAGRWLGDDSTKTTGDGTDDIGLPLTTAAPTGAPTGVPTAAPTTTSPTDSPTASPTYFPTKNPWQLVVEVDGFSETTPVDVGEETFNSLFGQCGAVRYKIDNEVYSVYIRETDYSDALSPYILFTTTWSSDENLLGDDFNLYSNDDNAWAGQNPWLFCNYDDSCVGFPRDCGPSVYIPYKWFYLPNDACPDNHILPFDYNFKFEIFVGEDCPSSIGEGYESNGKTKKN